MANMLNLTGERFGRLVALEPSHRYRRCWIWRCVCDCGSETLVHVTKLRLGHTQSCGCLKFDKKRTHGHASNGKGSPTYQSWANMLGRVTNPNHPRYSEWGGRGIKVCDRWRSFENFLADMGERVQGTTLDRIDNNGNYEPGNCRWATRAEQMANRRVCISPEVGERVRALHASGLSMRAVGRQVGVPHSTVGRILRFETAKGS